MTLRRMRINESVSSEYDSEESFTETESSNSQGYKSPPLRSQQSIVESESFDKSTVTAKIEEIVEDVPIVPEEKANSAKNSDEYIIEDDNLYVDCKIEMNH